MTGDLHLYVIDGHQQYDPDGSQSWCLGEEPECDVCQRRAIKRHSPGTTAAAEALMLLAGLRAKVRSDFEQHGGNPTQVKRARRVLTHARRYVANVILGC